MSGEVEKHKDRALIAKRRQWQDQFDVAALVLRDESGKLEWAKDDHVAFRYAEPGVRIVFYPHRTSANHYHIRIRDEGSKDKERFDQLAARLYIGSGYSCTFSIKNRSAVGINSDRPAGWAAKEALGFDWI